MNDTYGLRELATRAHSGTSFVPERRAEQHLQDIEAELAAAREWIAKVAPAELVEELYSDFEAGYLAKYRAWLAAKSRCVSWMIAGPSRFPVRQQEKRNATEHRRLGELIAFKAAARRRIMRRVQEARRPEDPAAEVKAEIAKLERQLEVMKTVNAILRKKKLTREQKAAAIVAAVGFKETTAQKLLEPDFAGRLGFPAYELTSVNGKIKRLHVKLRVLETVETGPITGQGWEITEDAPADRLRIHFDRIPAPELREQLKRSGFRWSPREGAWQRQLTEHARRDARAIVLTANKEAM